MVSLVLLATAAAAATVAAADPDYDVVVYGSSPSGIAAATAAGRLGLTVAVCKWPQRGLLMFTRRMGACVAPTRKDMDG